MMNKLQTLCLIILIFVVTSSQSADKIQSKSNKLNSIQHQIGNINQHLQQDENKRVQLIALLKQSELAINQTAHDIEHTKKQLKAQTEILAHLEEKEKNYQLQIQQQSSLLAQQIRAQYMLGQHQYIKLLLNQKDPNKISRLLAYYRYISKARIDMIHDLKNTLNALTHNEKQIEKHYHELQQISKKRTRENITLKNQLTDRKLVLERLNISIKNKNQRLRQLHIDANSLSQLISKLKEQRILLQKIKIPITKMQHKLKWPTRGTITQGFGTQIGDSELTYNGIFISAPTGQAVKAIYPGKVVFADWLRGVGLLVIIEHNQGVMTLYGHQNTINVKVGDIIASGKIIGTVGKSGGIQKSGLYFQIRDNGKPLNPSDWLV